ncbi:uncharacterized protein M2272_001848 [Mycobacterium frederiksbergense]|uniref:DUF418 domain-containing protein n=1 Tax=Mycolicibacterium frederiksbergense TaxID=117567 RepID=A0ABT6KWX7_9MYCO|nr:DUF418 domain-containing protein [Mycolicibacterium frederiksbergense]MDH6195219.1 uncharacterized protein [Mycolicibacterium frederiksbergense]
MTSQRIVDAVPRIAALDILRGFALGGILIVNITVMSNPAGLAAGPVRTLLTAFFFDKFYVLFSFLFGYSLTLQFRSAERDGVDARLRTVRRCFALMAIGLVHIAFFFSGDVLFGYGILGLILLALSRIRPARAVQCAAILYGSFVLALTVHGMVAPPADAVDPRAIAEIKAGWLTAASYRWETFFERFDLFLVFGLLNVLPLFLIGFAAGKARLLETPNRYLPVLPRLQWIGFGIAAPLSLLAAIVDKPQLAGAVALLDLPLAAAYAATILRLTHSRPGLAHTLGTAGKFAATNYICQSVIASVIFTGYGFALVGQLPNWQVLAIAAAIYGAQLVGSRLWARRHRYGPLEWVLRRVTYGRREKWPER